MEPKDKMEEERSKSFFEHLDILLERVPQVKSFDEKVDVDLHLATCDELEVGLEKLQATLSKRKAAADEAKLKVQLQHLGDQLQLNDKIPLSIPHLEIYRNFLGRIAPPTPESQELSASLTKRICALLADHPNRAEPRSGDREYSGAKGANLTSVPIRRRRQMAVTFIFNFFTGPLMVMFLIFLFWWFFPYIWATCFTLYYAWVYHSNKTRPLFGEGSGMNEEYRRWFVFKHFCDYFPLRIVKDDPAADYAGSNLFCIHPHGVQCVAIFGFLTKYCGTEFLFPGNVITAQTLPMNFWAPVMREHCVAVGCGNASAKSIKKALTWCEGASTGLVVGGAKEAIHAAPHTNKIALKDRYGFVKMALLTGASLVPCYSFGENSLYDNLSADRPRIIKWQRRLQQMLTFAPLFVAGRGVFSYSGGLIPHRRPVTTVVGAPIPIAKNDNPSRELVQAIHARYVKALKELFEMHRDIYDPKVEDMELI